MLIWQQSLSCSAGTLLVFFMYVSVHVKVLALHYGIIHVFD